MKREVRTFSFQVETRADDKPVIRGHAAVFNSKSQDLGGFKEQIAPGAFRKAIKEDDVRALFNHDSNIVLGRSKSGTLRMSEDEHGLAIEIDPPDTQQARDLMELMRRGDIDQMSFAFTVNDGGEHWERSGDEVIRTLMDVRLYDVSPVTYPAYEATDVGLRAFKEFLKEDGYPSEDARRKLRLAEV